MHNIYGIDKIGSGQRWGTESSYKTNYALLKTQETREGNGNGWKGMEGTRNVMQWQSEEMEKNHETGGTDNEAAKTWHNLQEKRMYKIYRQKNHGT